MNKKMSFNMDEESEQQWKNMSSVAFYGVPFVPIHMHTAYVHWTWNKTSVHV